MKIYIATPVNGRSEATLEEKRLAAYYRMCEIRKQLHWKFPDAEFHSSFDEHIAPIRRDRFDIEWYEATIIGRCVTEVMNCDAILMDWGYEQSKGCTVEHTTALTYGKKIIHAFDLDIEPERGVELGYVQHFDND